jgi:hypothetical protein
VFQVGPRIRVELNNATFEEVRKAAPLEAKFAAKGKEWVERLNAELHAAQAARKQPVKDGYKYHISRKGTRIRMDIRAFTARAAAHEKKHSKILKLMHTTGHDVEVHLDDVPTPEEIAEGEG